MDDKAKQADVILSQLQSHPDKRLDKALAETLVGLIGTILEEGSCDDQAFWKRYLDLTGDHRYIQQLSDRAQRYEWAETACRAVERGQYHLRDMFDRAVRNYPNRVFFHDMSQGSPTSFTYTHIQRRVRALAAALYRLNEKPRVAILCTNGVDSACCDLACLMYDVLVAPVNIHASPETISWVCQQLAINVVVTDTPEMLHRVEAVKQKAGLDLQIVAVGPLAAADSTCPALAEEALKLAPADIAELLGVRTRLAIDDVATVMFTSGSTGQPKGISFSMYNLVTKRFCRAAALPAVGDREKLICFLPLFHTFGRFFEMLGMVYWCGTYVFPGNPSADTLFALLPRLNATGLISVPLRWQQIYERCLERMSTVVAREEKEALFREVVGKRLHWGLSAAGYLAPQVFRFFNQHGVSLCSGFGMTEATGGITMTPPGEYRDSSIGIPLPGVAVRQEEGGELVIAGAYVARYLDEIAPGQTLPVDRDDEHRYWLPTGDLFKKLPDGHFEIVDRLKDIYKNNRGQTVAPRKVEKKYNGVPGVKRTFLVGDARAYNVLLIVPDNDDPVVKGFSERSNLHEYYHQIVSNANQDLAPYERVVNFAIVGRDFDADQGELTPKGSYRRKQIEKNFGHVISGLYENPYVEQEVNGLTIRLPRWMIRDLGILESDIEVYEDGIYDRYRGCSLHLAPSDKPGLVQIGDLLYQVYSEVIDLGLLSRHPVYWLGNPQLVAFCPCKEGWDLSVTDIAPRPMLPPHRSVISPVTGSQLKYVRDHKLIEVNDLVLQAYHDETETALRAVKALGKLMASSDERLVRVIRHRLEALSCHQEFEVRSQAYQVLLLDEPSKDYSRVLPSFIDSGLPFLDEKAIDSLATANLSRPKLEALRRRLFSYRTRLDWPASDVTRQQLLNILKLLKDFARYHPKYYGTVRAELASWILHDTDPELSAEAEKLFSELYGRYETNLSKTTATVSETQWEKLVVYTDEITRTERERLNKVLCGTTFIKQSVMLASDDFGFDMAQVAEEGIWISRIMSRRRYRRYRVSINTESGRHFDLQVILSKDLATNRVLDTVYWLMTISSYPYGPCVLPRLGCCRPELGARSLTYLGDLTVWEKIRDYSTSRLVTASIPPRQVWRKLFIRAMSAFFRAWFISGERTVPGVVSPDNVIVPDEDYRVGSMVSSLTEWQPYENTLSLVRPMLQSFFRKTTALYPWCQQNLDVEWIFDACVHGLGGERATEFLTQLRQDLEQDGDVPGGADTVREKLDTFVSRWKSEWYIPLPVFNAVNRYQRWTQATPEATPEARRQILSELLRLYRFDRQTEIARYYLYRNTYFGQCSDETAQCFDTLLRRLFEDPDVAAHHTIELSELQATITDPEDRIAFGRLVFPRAAQPQQVEVMTVGESDAPQVVVRTRLQDKENESFVVREPVEPAEIGRLYRLFLQAGYPKTISGNERFLLVIDSDDQLVGGLCYRYDGETIVHLDGSVVVATLSGRGIGSSLLEDFCSRLASDGVRVVKTHFMLRNFYVKRGFKVDERWGALVRFLKDPAYGD